MLIVEALATGKRTPAYAHDKVISLGDISIYTTEGDIALSEVLEKVKETANGSPIDVKALGNDQAVRDYFESILPAYDQERVYTTDIKKLFSWYNQLLAAGVTEFKDEESAQDSETEVTD